jgi:hypothetical protein
MVGHADDGLEETAVAALAVEYWKLLRASGRILGVAAEAETRRFEGQIRYGERQLELILSRLGAQLVTFEGEAFRDGMAASPENAEDYPPGANLVVERTIEPAVVRNMRLLRMGRVLLTTSQLGEGQA